MDRRRLIIIIVVVVILCCIVAYFGSNLITPTENEETPVQLPEPTNPAVTEVIEPTKTPIPEKEDTPIPEPTTWIGVITCPECNGIGLILWMKIDDKGQGGGMVFDGDVCIVIDKGVADGIEKYKLDCDGKIGWFRAEGVQPRQTETTR